MAYDRHRKRAKDIVNIYRKATLDSSAEIYNRAHELLEEARYDGFNDGWCEGLAACVDYIREAHGICLDGSEEEWSDVLDYVLKKKDRYISEFFPNARQ